MRSDITLALAELEACANERAEKWEGKRRNLDAELEERRQESEMKHEERMQTDGCVSANVHGQPIHASMNSLR